MTVRATWNDVVIAESDRTILVEGNQYFPPEDVRAETLTPSASQTHCPWKGEASYYDVVAGGDRNADAAWYYPEPFPDAESVRNYVAFWHGVEVTGSNVDTPEVLPPSRR
ncbi:MAG: DUF427 domain-containing protein [Acidimicrobiaceae bacterium]|nr:DUF427 domain-containing protein [Acidimicrobiaceae bacterium]